MNDGLRLASLTVVRCDHFEADRCRSCTWLPRPYPEQLAAKQAAASGRLAPSVPAEVWAEPFPSAEAGFRNKAKMVVGGTTAAPTLGILDGDRRGVDLRTCALHVPAVVEALPVLAGFVGRATLTPYDVTARGGELKHLIVTGSPDGELMVRFVLRSTEARARIEKHLPGLLAALPSLRVVSANLQPRPAAILEGPEELPLHGEWLAMGINDLSLRLRPQSFFQTNTEVAAALYRQARDWVADLDWHTAWDLYSGVGGFALHLAAPIGAGARVLGVEVAEAAVVAAAQTARAAGLAADFVAADATAWVGGQAEAPDLVVVNPPRRGLGAELAGRLERSGAPWLLYSSCHAESLARDLAAMPSYRVVRARLFDMFPHTAHGEVLVLLGR